MDLQFSTVCLTLILATLLVLALRYTDRAIGTEARRDLPGPQGIPLVGNLIQLLQHRKHMLMHLSHMEAQYGELFTFTMPGWGRNIVINRPEWLEHVRKRDTIAYGKGSAALNIFHEFPGSLSPFGTEGSEWKLSRRIMQPVFSARKFDSQVSAAMSQILPIACSLLETASREMIQIDFNELGGRLALAIFCKMALSLDMSFLTGDPLCLTHSDKTMHAVQVLNRISSGRLYNPFWPFTEMVTEEGKAFKKARREIHNIIDEVVRERRASSDLSSLDFLSSLLENPTATGDNALLQDTLVTLLFAGRDNTQNALSWSLYELSRHPRWIDLMKAEIDAECKPGVVVKYSNLSRFHIHLAVFYETLRLWPGVPKNARLALQDDVLPAIPDSGYPEIRISKGDYVLWSDYAMMRNPKVWGPSAGTFDPGRHLDTEKKFVKPPQPKFHAFGAGARLCPGAQLAAYEFVAIWASILPFFKITPIDSRDRLPADALTISMDGPFMVKVESIEEIHWSNN